MTKLVHYLRVGSTLGDFAILYMFIIAMGLHSVFLHFR